MALTEDLLVYLADFGVVCVKGTTTFQGILEQPDQELNFNAIGSQSREYALTYITTAVALKKADTLTVDGVNYVVRNSPNQQDDGRFSIAELTKP